jgi:hypothetical protein
MPWYSLSRLPKNGDADIERVLDCVLADANSWVHKDQAYAIA